jgi:hypothetical protein
MRSIRTLLCVLSLIGCDPAVDPPPPDMEPATMPDLAMATAPKSPGSPCAAAANCERPSDECWHTTLDDASGYELPGGMCTRSCSKDSDCGATAMCAPLYAPSGKIRRCLERCRKPSDCRAGFACFTYGQSFGYCYADDYLTCDAAGGQAASCSPGYPSGKAGGCLRGAASAPGANSGYCWDRCTLAAGCASVGGVEYACSLVDARQTTDYLGAPWGDTFAGLICQQRYQANPVGATCFSGLQTNGQAQLTVASCEAGAACYLKAMSPNGDDLCHTLCALPGGSCPSGTQCTDVYSLAASATPVGMCL